MSSHNNSASKNRILIHDIGKGIKNVQLNRPDKLNSLDMQMFESIAETAMKLKDDDNIRGIILSGSGKAFCTGLDVKSIVNPSKEHGGLPTTKMNRLLERPSGYYKDIIQNRENDEDCRGLVNEKKAIGNLAQDVAYLWRSIPVPVIAVLHGMCFGGGLQIALGADLRFATKDCRISIMESKWGLIPDMSASITLRELVRIDVAKELTFTGRIISGTEAASLGLVTRCIDEDPMEEAIKVMNEIADRSPDAIAAAKHLFQSTWVSDEKECLELESKLQKRLLPSWNQFAASSRTLGLNVSYMKRKELK